VRALPIGRASTAVVLVAAAFASCGGPSPSDEDGDGSGDGGTGGARCLENADCPEGWSCRAGECRRDASDGDAGGEDGEGGIGASGAAATSGDGGSAGAGTTGGTSGATGGTSGATGGSSGAAGAGPSGGIGQSGSAPGGMAGIGGGAGASGGSAGSLVAGSAGVAGGGMGGSSGGRGGSGGAGGGSIGLPFFEDFESGDDGWDSSSDWNLVIDGSTVYEQPLIVTGQFRSTFPGSPSLTNFSISARIRIVMVVTPGPESWAAVCRLVNSQNYYCFAIREDGSFGIRRRVNNVGSWLNTGTVAAPPQVWEWQSIRFTIVGSTLSGYFNDTLVATATDTSFPTGQLALATYQAQAHFDDVSATVP